jgi:hypothetical protein
MQVRARLFSLIALCAAGLVSLAGCGSSSSSSSVGVSPTPTSSSNGITIYPPSASVPVGGQAIFTGYVPSQPSSTITWTVSSSSNGTITTNSSGEGVYTAPTSVPSPAQVAITATSGNFSATAVVTVTSAQGLTVSPAAASIPAGTTTQFSAMMNGAAATGVTWQVNGTTGGDGVHGTIDTTGNYTAPLTPPPTGSTVITALVGSSSGTATVTVVFSNASLSGNYSFAYTGDDSSGYLGVVGNFTADPSSGNITGAEDILSAALSAPATGVAISGTYSVGPDGRGTVNISTTSETWQFAIASNQHAVMINFGQIATTGVATGSGTIDLQTTATPLAAGRYVFQLAGLDGNGSPLGIEGGFASTGTGALPTAGNVLDMNDAGSAGTNNTLDDTSLTGSFTGSTLTLTSTDLGQLPGITGTSLTFDYYLVNANHIRLIETDGFAFLTGDVFAEPAAPGSGYAAAVLPQSNYAFTLGGATQSPYAAGGVFTSNGGGTSPTSTSGNITGGEFDNNNGGAHFQTDATLTSTSYTVDPTTGRMSSSITTSAGTFNWVGYVTSPVDPTNPDSVQVLMMESDQIAVASGTAYLQSSTSEPSGSFALNLTGQATGTSGGEQDVLAQVGIATTGITGSIDINNFALGTTSEGLNIVTSKSTIAATDSSGRGTATIVAADGASFPVAYYVVDQNTVVMIETDSQRVMTGLMLKQF